MFLCHFKQQFFQLLRGRAAFFCGAVHWNYPTYPPARHHVGNQPFEISGPMQPAITFGKKLPGKKNTKLQKFWRHTVYLSIGYPHLGRISSPILQKTGHPNSWDEKPLMFRPGPQRPLDWPLSLPAAKIGKLEAVGVDWGQVQWLPKKDQSSVFFEEWTYMNIPVASMSTWPTFTIQINQM